MQLFLILISQYLALLLHVVSFYLPYKQICTRKLISIWNLNYALHHSWICNHILCTVGYVDEKITFHRTITCSNVHVHVLITLFSCSVNLLFSNSTCNKLYWPLPSTHMQMYKCTCTCRCSELWVLTKIINTKLLFFIFYNLKCPYCHIVGTHLRNFIFDLKDCWNLNTICANRWPCIVKIVKQIIQCV